jgi:hypothetical protein
MRFNRILTSIADWINALLWWREGEVHQKPYETLYTHRVEGRGIMLLVARDPTRCPRDVGSLIWLPARAYHPGAKDCHILIDHLDGMARNPHQHTHQITIAIASHWPDRDGLYTYDLLYCATADLQGQQLRRDMNVRKILTTLAHPLGTDEPDAVNWELQLIIAMKSCSLNCPRPRGTIAAVGVDNPGAIATIRLD